MDSNIEIKHWDDLNINTNLLRGIYSHGFEKPSEIQKKAIYPIINKKDVIAQAQSGTGKTGAFSISSLQSIDTSLLQTQVMIIVPTRELVTQINKVMKALSDFMENVSIKILVGGTSVANDIEDLKSPPHIIIGTPGRIYDMIKRKKINMLTIQLFILDEADEMLSRGFKEQIHTIFQYLHENVQVAIFSATFPTEVMDLTNKFMNNPEKITIKKENLTLDGIQQSFIATANDHEKLNWLITIYKQYNGGQSIVFVNDINRVTALYNEMKNNGFSVGCMHSSLSKDERADVLQSFVNGNENILISSNIIARGIDVHQVNLVINFDIPNSVHTYLHRIGRSGRWGRKGNAINFVSERDIENMRKIEHHYEITINEFTNII
uniref:RNA helicase n=1 Tax=viral metagenome TaxID=1070528 RepID=A0A6C0FB63_9ZZZZ|tara:strand:+ start:19740 stop:20876 length:1137 start_codon:yes stop_codon:yes gene_type:complete